MKIRNLSLWLFVLCFIFSAQSLLAQTIFTIGSGTSTTSAYSSMETPFGTYYHDDRTVFRYNASEFAAAGAYPGDIASVAFNVASAASQSMGGFTVKIGFTSSTAALGSFPSGMTTVYSASSYTASSGWNTFNFTTPVFWNGTDNVLIEVCFDNSSYTTSSTVYYTPSTGNGYSRYADSWAGPGCSMTGGSGGAFTNRPNARFGILPPPNNNIGIAGLASPTLPACAGTFPVQAVLQNYGGNAVTSASVGWSVNGVTQTSSSFTGYLDSVTGSGATNTTLTLGSVTITSSPTTIKVWSSSPNGQVDTLNANDTIELVYTGAMSGNYTIGGTNPDFSTVDSAIIAMNSAGLCGPVTFHVRQGTYTEQLNMTAISGASATNTITFISDTNNSTLPVIQNSGYVWKFTGTGHVTLENLVLTATGSSRVVEMYGVNEDLTFEGCTFNGASISSTSNFYAVIFQNTGSGDRTIGFTVNNCEINGGSYAIYHYGYWSSSGFNSDFTFTNNKAQGFYYIGIYNYGTDTSLIAGNEITSNGTYSGAYVIYNLYGSQAKINGNRISYLNSASYGYGIYISSCNGTSTSRCEANNNMVTVPNVTTGSRGIYTSSSYWDIDYNSIYTTGTSTSTSYAGIYASSSTSQVRNNLVYKNGTGYAAYVSTSAVHSNNVFYNNSGTLTNFTLGSTEYNSNPMFYSDTNLYISSISDGYNNATPLTGTTVDIDGNTRNVSTPDIGASEYTLPENDAGVSWLISPMSPFNPSTQNVSFEIKNYGLDTLDTVQVNWSYNGTTQTSVQYVGSLASGDVDTVTVGSITFPSGSSQLIGWTSMPNNVTDENMSNDTMQFDVCTALNGVYSVGTGSGFDFATLSDAASALYTCGISGAVTFDVDAASGPYNEQLLLEGAIPGASATNTVTFAGGGSEINHNVQTSDLAIVRLQSAKHVTLDSFEINTSSSYGWGVQFSQGADSNTVSNCEINIPNSSSTWNSPIVFTGSNTSYSTSWTGGNGNYNTIENNSLMGGFSGISSYSSSSTYSNTGNIIIGNTIDGFYYYGMYLRYTANTTVEGNDISRLSSTGLSTFYGIYLYYGGNNNLIKGNAIHDPWPSGSGTTYGMYVFNCDADSANPNKLINNVMYNFTGSTSTTYGVYSYSNDYLTQLHNTYNLDDPSGTSGTVYGNYFSSTHNNGVYRNNIVSVVKGGTSSKYNMYFATTPTNHSSQYNVFWNDTNSSSSYVAYYSGTQAELSNWQSVASGIYGFGSQQEPPAFINAAAGDLTPQSLALDNDGVPQGITTDFYGATRSLTTPDFGAIEFTGVPGDIALTSASLTRESLCYGTNDTISVTVQNTVGSTVDFSTDSLMVSWSVTGPVNSSGSFYINSGTMPLGGSFSAQATGANLSIPGTYTLYAAIDTNVTNATTGNDSMMVSSAITVDTILTVTPGYSYVTSPNDSFNLNAASPLFPGADVKFSEITQWHASTGQPVGGWSSYSWASDDDGLELIGAPLASLDGFTVERWSSSGSSPVYSFTFGSNASFNANGVAYLGWGGTAGAVNTTYNYYSAGISCCGLSSGTTAGYVVRDPSGNIVDVVVNGTFFTWSSASGVTSGDWSANMTSSSSSTSGIRRIAATDNNSGSDWVVSSSTYPQDPGTYNATVNTISGPTVSGIYWYEESTMVDSNVTSYEVGPYTMDDTIMYYATYNSACGVYTDSALVVIDLTKAMASNVNNVSCFGGSNGTAAVTAWGGDAPYSYAWSDGQTTDTATNLMAGTYYVTVTDNNGWPATDSVVITEPDTLDITLAATPSTCGVANGTATVTPTGGTTPYTYAWSNGGTTATISGLVSASYDVTVTDANGCMAMGTQSVVDAGSPSISFAVTNVVCGGDLTGAVTPTVTGGTAPYNYTWSNGSTASSISGLGIGDYTLTITDAAACVVFEDTSIVGNDTLQIASSGTNVTCNGVGDGTAQTMVSGGVASYTYAWSTGATTDSIGALTPSSYTVTATDAVGCTIEDTVVITEPASLVAAVDSSEDATCKDLSNGIAYAGATGGTMPYAYSWSNSSMMATATGLADGSYQVTITDANGCTDSASVMIGEPDSLLASITSTTNIDCYGASTGSITVTVTGGTMPYAYGWTSGASTATYASAPAGTHTVNIFDANNCFVSASGTLTQNTQITAVDSVIMPLCNGDTNGSLYITTAGGVGSYGWAWSNSATSEDITNIEAGSYTVTITDGLSCSEEYTFTVGQPDSLLITNVYTTNSFCEYGNNGKAFITPTGGTMPYDYSWSNGDSVEDPTDLMVGTYYVTVTDTNGCMNVDSATVDFTTPAPAFTIQGKDTICHGEINNLVVLGVASWNWSTGSTQASTSATETGWYSVTISASNGCTNFDSFYVYANDSIAIDMIGTNASCEMYTDGSVEANVSGGTSPYNFVWSGGTTGATLENVGAGTYSVVVVDGIGCIDSAETAITFDNEHPVIGFPADTTVCTYTVFTLDPGVAGGTYAWSTGDTTQSITVNSPGVYTVELLDANGCNAADSVEVMYDECNGIDEISTISMMLYPNPTRGLVNIEFDQIMTNDINVKVMSASGSVVIDRTLIPAGSSSIGTIDLTEAASGVYFIEISDGNFRTTKRVSVN